MTTLNLVYPEKSDIVYKKIQMPDGQQQIIIDINSTSEKNIHFETIEIKSRLNNFMDLELIICATQSLKELNIKKIHLYVPYFLGGRSDRKFEEGSCNYLKQVICPIINNLNFESVNVLDTHSDVLEACLNNFNKCDNEELFSYAVLEHICAGKGIDRYLKNDILLLSPDAGASKKIYKLADKTEYKGDIITCLKNRDENGKLTKTVVPNMDLNKNIIIIDDICDGGRTFIEIAKVIKERYNGFVKELPYSPYEKTGKMYLIITHGIFSKGFEELSHYFDGVYCTNSYSDINELNGLQNNNFQFKQLNIF